MKKQFISVIIVGLGLLAILLAWANAVEPPQDTLPRILAAAVVFASPVTVMFLKRRNQGRTLEQTDGSFEKEMSTRAQSAAYVDSLVILVAALAVVAIFANSLLASLTLLAAILLAVAAFWFRYHRAKRSLLSDGMP